MQNYCFSILLHIGCVAMHKSISHSAVYLPSVCKYILFCYASQCIIYHIVHKVLWNSFEYLPEQIVRNAAQLIEQFDRETEMFEFAQTRNVKLKYVYFHVWTWDPFHVMIFLNWNYVCTSQYIIEVNYTDQMWWDWKLTMRLSVSATKQKKMERCTKRINKQIKRHA